MPNELRIPENRIDQFDVSIRAIQIIDMYDLLSSETVLNRGIQNKVFEGWWPDQTPEEIQVMINAFLIMDNENREVAPVNPNKVKEGQESKIVGSKILIEDNY